RSLLDQPVSDGKPAIRRTSEGKWVFDHPTELWDVPKSIEDAIATRLHPLTREQRDLLDSAAVIGRVFRYETLQGLTGLSDDELLECLDGLMDLDLIREVHDSENTLAFTHRTVREVVYSRMTGIRR